MLQSILQNPNAIPFILIGMIGGVVITFTFITIALSNMYNWWLTKSRD